MGRPKLPRKKLRSAIFNFRMTASLRKALERRAKQEGKTLGKYINDVLQSKIDDERGE